MQTVSSEWRSAHLENIVPASFVEISYRISDPEADIDVSAADNGSESFSETAEITTTDTQTFNKYATLELNSWGLDGGAAIWKDNGQDFGFVSSSLSGEDGTFSTVPIITLSFTQTHTAVVPGVTVTWSEAFDEFADTYVVTAYNGSTVVSSQTITGNKKVISYVPQEIAGYNKITIEILKWSLPRHRARIENVIIGALKMFDKTTLVGYEHSQHIDLLTFELPKAEVMFNINNVEGEWNPDNPQGIYRYLLERQEITVRYGYKLSNGVEWIKAGRFFMSEWETPQNGVTASFKARDALEFMSNKFVVSGGTYTLMQLATMAFEQADLPLLANGNVRWNLDNSLSSITVEIPTNDDGAVDFDFTCAEVVQLCANAALCVMYQDRDGVVNVKPLAATLTDYVVDRFNSYSNSEYSVSKELKAVDVNDGLATVQNSAKGEIQTAQNPLIQNGTVATGVAEWIKDVLSGRKTVSGQFRADPRLDVGDAITVGNKYAENTVVVTDIKYSYNGAFHGTYEGRVLI